VWICCVGCGLCLGVVCIVECVVILDDFGGGLVGCVVIGEGGVFFGYGCDCVILGLD